MCARPSGCYHAMCARDLRGYRAAPMSLSSRYSYGTTRLVCDLDSPRARASDRPSSRVQGSPAPCLVAHPQAPEERTRELGS
jgi:hypothetical protein